MNPPNPSTHDKALAINLHPAQYGTFAEIGAGSGSGALVLPRGRGRGHGGPLDLRL